MRVNIGSTAWLTGATKHSRPAVLNPLPQYSMTMNIKERSNRLKEKREAGVLLLEPDARVTTEMKEE